ncbi:MAG: hypothetical protein ACLQVD_18695 [Capsulimonadaceae bacterium]
MARLLVLLCVAAVLVCIGGQGLLNIAQHPRPAPVSYARFVATRPQSGWYAISGGHLDMQTVTMLVDGSGRHRYFMALRGPHEDASSPAHVMFEPTDPTLEHIAIGLFEANKEAAQAFHTMYGDGSVPALVGMVMTQTDLSEQERGKIVRDAIQKDPNMVVLEMNSRPSAIVPVVLLALGLLLAFVAFRLQSGDRAQAQERAALDSQAAEGASAGGAPRFRMRAGE